MTNIVLWMLLGGALGWIGYAYLGFNEKRGMIASVIIGAVGGVLGGKMVAPLFIATAAVPDDIGTAAIVFAVGTAAALLAAGNLIHNRWGV